VEAASGRFASDGMRSEVAFTEESGPIRAQLEGEVQTATQLVCGSQPGRPAWLMRSHAPSWASMRKMEPAGRA